MTAMVRAQSVRGYRELVTDLGGNPNRLLRRAGVDPAALDQLTGFISFETLIALLERSAAELDCPDFGLRLAERQDIGILGTLSVAMRNSATLGEAMRCASRYMHVYNAAVAFTVDVEEGRSQAGMMFGVIVEHAASWAQTSEHGIGLAWRILTLLSEGRCQLQRVWFPHPAVASRDSYEGRFEATLTFETDRCGLAVAAKDLDLPISEHNEQLHDLATRYLEGEVSPGPGSFRLQVRQAIEALLGTGTCSYRQVAGALHMHPRTLQRRLHEEGTTFEAIKDETRRDLAERYLSQRNVPLTQVSALLDYSEQSALGRSCRRWFQTTPRAVREQLSA
jgi:AraC-like DNA-binding protein